MGEAQQPLHTACFPKELWQRKQSQDLQAEARDVQECVGFKYRRWLPGAQKPGRPILTAGQETPLSRAGGQAHPYSRKHL